MKIQQKSIIRKLLSCIIEKFNGFTIVHIENDREICKKFYAINIIYKPVKKLNENIERYFSAEVHLAYRGIFNDGEKIKHSTACKCYYCSNFYGRKDKYDRHIENCTG